MTGPGPADPTEGVRPPVPGSAVALAWIAAGLTVLGALCCAGGAVLSVEYMQPELQAAEQELEALEADDQRVVAARAQLANLAALLDQARGASPHYPETLPEAPPQDPWKTPVSYSRTGPDRAVLRSAGPDRAFGTPDDLVHELRR